MLSCKVVRSLHLSDDDDLSSTDTNEHNISEDFPSIFQIKCNILTFYNIHHEQNLGQTSICSIDTHYSMLQMISVEGAEVWPDEATACTVEGRGC